MYYSINAYKTREGVAEEQILGSSPGRAGHLRRRGLAAQGCEVGGSCTHKVNSSESEQEQSSSSSMMRAQRNR